MYLGLWYLMMGGLPFLSLGQTFFEGWFRGAKLCSDIKEGNVREFLAW